MSNAHYAKHSILLDTYDVHDCTMLERNFGAVTLPVCLRRRTGSAEQPAFTPVDSETDVNTHVVLVSDSVNRHSNTHVQAKVHAAGENSPFQEG